MNLSNFLKESKYLFHENKIGKKKNLLSKCEDCNRELEEYKSLII